MNVIGISRDCQFSPNHENNDAAIFRLVMEELQKFGYAPAIFSEKEFADVALPEGNVTVVSMARSTEVLEKLKQWHSTGAYIANPPHGITNCIRIPMTIQLINAGSPHPISWIVETAQVDTGLLTYPCWIKRGESHAMQKEDICYATTRKEADSIFADLQHRGIPSAVVNEHLRGDLVKFYGVMDSDFFYWFYPTSLSHSKFGIEIINGEARGLAFNPTALKEYANQAAQVLDVPIYGGDAIVMENGEIKLIDFNDWPSFAPCREEAAKAIADYINQRIYQSE